MSPVTPSVAPARGATHARAAAALAEVEAERAALSRLLHDEVLQSLLAARFTAELAGNDDVRDSVREAIAEASNAMWRLKPRTTAGQLVDALGQLAERRTGVVLSVRSPGVPERLDPAAATVAFRVVQAALDACRGTTMEANVAVRGGVLTVAVSDDGEAYDDAAYAPDSELTRWLSRAGLLGGSARLGDSAAGGTTLWLEIPDALAHEEGDR